jgi:hypothetical protein
MSPSGAPDHPAYNFAEGVEANENYSRNRKRRQPPDKTLPNVMERSPKKR